jgi:hypothetical protein
MPFCYCPRSFILKVVSIRRNKAIGEEQANRAIVGGQEKKGYSEGEVYEKERPLNPTYIFF